MRHVDYFKFQAKNLFRDYKTQFFNEKEDVYDYRPSYFDVNQIVLDYDIDEDDFSLMKAQHIIANMSGFRKWADMLNASEAEQELARLLLSNRDIINLEDWEMYIHQVEHENNLIFSTKDKLEILKLVWLNDTPEKPIERQANKYAKSAFIAAGLVLDHKLDPETAWNLATQEVFQGKATKACSRGAFLGLMTKVRSGKNAGYALDALEILKKNPEQSYKPLELWRELKTNISHNCQMNVLLALWNEKRYRKYIE